MLARYVAGKERMDRCYRERESAGDDAHHQALSAEIKEIQGQLQAIYRELRTEAVLYPAECLACFNRLEWTLSGAIGGVKNDIGRLLLPVVDAEVLSDSATPGPVLQNLLLMAQGSVRDQMFLVRFSEDLTAGSRDLAKVCMDLLESDLKYSALAALGRQGQRGNLGEFFKENRERLYALALTGSQDRPAVFAYLALSAIGDPETDEMILRDVEASASSPDSWYRAAAMSRVASRIGLEQSGRVRDTLLRIFDTGFEHLSAPHWFRAAISLTSDDALIVLAFAHSKLPAGESNHWLKTGLENLKQCVQAGLAGKVAKETDEIIRNQGGQDYPVLSVATKLLAANK
jgi:hypothetical protein